METTYTTPIKTMHGSNFRTLQNEYIRTIQDLNEAMRQFKRIDFNARDYASHSAFIKATVERIEAYQKLEQVSIYLEEIAISLNH